MVTNQQVSACTKHIDVRHHFIRELSDQGELTVEFLKSFCNISDGMTKNVCEKIFHSHMPKLCGHFYSMRENVEIQNEENSEFAIRD